MSLYYLDDLTTIHHGGALDVLRAMPDESVHSIVTDPPYGLSNTDPRHVAETITRWVSGDREYVPSGRGFMGKEWDAFVPPVAVWDECLRVLKPGGHLLAFAGSRTADLMGLAIRLAGFDIRDTIMWLYGSGFPKSMNVGKAIDATVLTGKSGSRSIREATDSREVIGTKMGLPGKSAGQKPGTYFSEAMEAEDGKDLDIRAERLGGSIAEGGHRRDLDITAPATPEAVQWDGWGTALKPAHEPIIMARKPLAEKTVARNVLAHGTGAINVDACRITTAQGDDLFRQRKAGPGAFGLINDDGWIPPLEHTTPPESGRWPANVALDEDAAEVLDRQSGTLKTGAKKAHHQRHTVGGNGLTHGRMEGVTGPESEANEGGASRFFYVAKAPKRERPVVDGIAHPTVKPLALMRWLVRMVTPPDGVVLDPFVGSGTTVEAAILEEIRSVGIELSAEYLPLIEARIERSTPTYTLEDLL